MSSLIFNTSVIKTNEALLMVKAIKETSPNASAKEVLDDLQLIDDLLYIQSTKALLNRKRGLRSLLEFRIEKELGINRTYSQFQKNK